MRVDDHAREGVPVEFLRAGKEIRAERDETLPEVTHTGRGKLPTVLAGHQLDNDLAEVSVDAGEAGQEFAVTLDH